MAPKEFSLPGSLVTPRWQSREGQKLLHSVRHATKNDNEGIQTIFSWLFALTQADGTVVTQMAGLDRASRGGA